MEGTCGGDLLVLVRLGFVARLGGCSEGSLLSRNRPLFDAPVARVA